VNVENECCQESVNVPDVIGQRLDPTRRRHRVATLGDAASRNHFER
jgi:hypothetical protein